MTPIIQVSIDGQVVSGLAGRVLRGEIVESDGKRADELTISLSNYDGRLAKPRRGAMLSVALGFEETGIATVGTFEVQEVTKIGAEAAFEITAHSADFKKTLKAQKTRSWIKSTLGAVLTAIAGDNGLTPAIDCTLAAVAGNFHQTGVSDIHYVTELARRYGAIGKVAQGRLVFVPKGSGAGASGAAMPAVVVTPNDLEGNFRISDKDRPHRGRVKGVVYDRKTAARREVTAGSTDGPDYVFPHVFGSDVEAQKAVDARKREFDRSGKTFSGTLKTGSNAVKAGGLLTTQGFGDDDDGDWTLERVTHDFGDHGYVTRFEAKTKAKPQL